MSVLNSRPPASALSTARIGLLFDATVKILGGTALVAIVSGLWPVHHGLTPALLAFAGIACVIGGATMITQLRRLLTDERSIVAVIVVDCVIAAAFMPIAIQQWQGITTAGGNIVCGVIAAASISSVVVAFTSTPD
ncbi:hypothetical protein ACFWM1_28340 [Nocardia sp. NPDC058379]|uniref:hypothetical protein n=1 Tax=unclassified Nocardia TaxID=2637762 RepID=UPI003664584E